MVLDELAQNIDTINRIDFQKWHSKFKIVISKDFEFEVVALVDSGTDLDCIQEGIIPSKYFQHTMNDCPQQMVARCRLNTKSQKPMSTKITHASKQPLP